MRSGVALLALTAVVAAAGCGGGGGAHKPARAEPVGMQLRGVLQRGFHAQPPLGALQRRVGPLADVKGCVGPSGGRAGLYRCALIPHRTWMPSVLTVSVDADGSWRTQTLVRSRGVQGLWGAGLVLPAR